MILIIVILDHYFCKLCHSWGTQLTSLSNKNVISLNRVQPQLICYVARNVDGSLLVATKKKANTC